MLTLRHLVHVSLLVFALAGIALAQENRAPVEAQRETAPPAVPLVTASATVDRVRFVSPGSVIQVRLEVYNETGQKLFDSELHGGNVLDWHLQNGLGERLASGSYACVLTLKSLSGRISQRVGVVNVNDKEAAIETAGAARLTTAQRQTIGPVEDNASLTTLPQRETEAITTATHDSAKGQLTSTTGPLAFGTGDVFAGKDKEHMRITEDGRVGIGTDKPQATLDVAGLVRAREGLMFSDGSTLKVNEKGVLTRTSADGTAPSAVSSTQNRLAKFTDNAGTVGDSLVVDTGTGLQLTVAPSGSVETNLLYLNSTSGTTGMLAGITPSYGAANGPFFAMRGNTYSTVPNQRGLLAIGAGNVSSPEGDDGSVKFNTGNDLLRMVIRPNGSVGIGTSIPRSLFDVAGNINTSTQYNIDGNRVFSIAGRDNTFAGLNTGTNNISSENSFLGADNSFFGSQAGAANTIGTQNSFFGSSAGIANTTGGDNSFFGHRAGLHNTTGNFNSFFGYLAGGSNTTSTFHAFFGAFAGVGNTTGEANSFFGYFAGLANTTGSNNSFFGAGAGSESLTGSFNSFFGRSAGKANTTGLGNSFFGAEAGFANTSGVHNSFFGLNAGRSNTTGVKNSFFGLNAGLRNTTADNNSFFGSFAGQENTTGITNAFFGQSAGFSNTTGQANTFIGSSAAANNTTGSFNIVIGPGSGSGLSTGNSNIYIGNSGANESTTIRIGTEGTQAATFIAGINGINVNPSTSVVVNSSGQLGVIVSSRRYKQEIRGMGDASSKLMQLRPVTFFYRPEYVAGDQTLQYGLIAEEVARVYPDLVALGPDGKPQTVRYHLLSTMLLNEVQKQEAHIRSQAQQLQGQAREIADLRVRLRRLESQASAKRQRR